MWEDEIVLRQMLEAKYGLKHENDQDDRANPMTATAEKEITSGEAVKTLSWLGSIQMGGKVDVECNIDLGLTSRRSVYS